MVAEFDFRKSKKKDDRWGSLFFDFDNVEKMMDDMMKDFFERDEESEAAFRRKPMVMGFSIKQGPDGKIMVEEFGDIKGKGGKPIISDKREPLVNVVSSGKDVIITAELPGVSEKSIKVDAKGNNVIISVDSKEMPYYKEVELEEKIDPKSKKINFKNGILEVSFRKGK